MTSRTILITGGNGGLGQALAQGFLAEPSGHTVWLGVRSRREKAEALAADFSGRVQLVDLDVTSDAAWKQAVERCGTVDVLVNNAGHHDDALLATMTPNQWSQVIDSNLTGAFLGCQAVIRGMLGQRWGRIVNIASLSALLAPAGQTNYAAAKAGLVAMTHSFAKEVARANITVNAVCPGFIETEALAEMDDAVRKARSASVPMRRFGRPEEVAAAVVFLASDAASYITGSTLKIDGGLM